MKPMFWGAGVGFNLKLFNDYIQNDLMLNFGSINAEEAIIDESSDNEDSRFFSRSTGDGTGTGEAAMNFLFYFRDKLYFSLDWKWVGLRAGISAALGVYGIPDFPTVWDLFINAGGLVGVCILPHSLVSITLDFCPGYTLAFRFSGFNKNDAGLSFPLFLGVRFNLDKL